MFCKAKTKKFFISLCFCYLFLNPQHISFNPFHCFLVSVELNVSLHKFELHIFADVCPMFEQWFLNSIAQRAHQTFSWPTWMTQMAVSLRCCCYPSTPTSMAVYSWRLQLVQTWEPKNVSRNSTKINVSSLRHTHNHTAERPLPRPEKKHSQIQVG